jgi:putative flavoprotein involved in K+ transport
MTRATSSTYLADYARLLAPRWSRTAPSSASAATARLRRDDHRPTWHAAHVVMATGWCDQPAVPAFAAALDRPIAQVVPSRYRTPVRCPTAAC